MSGDLKEQSLLVREERVLDTIPERLQPFRSCLEELRQELPIDRVFLSPKALEDLPGKEILAGADRILEQLNADIEKVAQALDAALTRAEQEIRGVHGRFETRRAAVRSAYEKKLRAPPEIPDRRRGVHPAPPQHRRAAPSQGATSGAGTRGSGISEPPSEPAGRMGGHEGGRIPGTRTGRQARHPKAERDGFGCGSSSAGTANRCSSSSGMRSADGYPRRSAPSGRRTSLSPGALVQACRQGAGSLAAEFGIYDSQAKRLAQASDETLMRIEEARSPVHHRDRAQHRPAGRPEKLAGAGPALYWPEGHRRSAAVAAGVRCTTCGRSAGGRPGQSFHHGGGGAADARREAAAQFLFSTHNANIPVLGDAELIVGLSALGDAEGRQREDRTRAHGLHRRTTRQKAGGRAARRGRGRIRAPAPQVRILR